MLMTAHAAAARGLASVQTGFSASEVERDSSYVHQDKDMHYEEMTVPITKLLRSISEVSLYRVQKSVKIL